MHRAGELAAAPSRAIMHNSRCDECDDVTWRDAAVLQALPDCAQEALIFTRSARPLQPTSF